MCGKKKVYKIHLHSFEKMLGTNSDALFNIKLPYVVNDGYIHISNLTLYADGNELNGVNSIKICSDLGNMLETSINNRSLSCLGEIALNSKVVKDAGANDHYVRYSKIISSEDIGFHVNNFDLTRVLNIKLKDDQDAILNHANIDNFQMTLIIIDNDPDN